MYPFPGSIQLSLPTVLVNLQRLQTPYKFRHQLSEVIRYNIYYELTIHKDISDFLVISKSHTPILVDYSSSGLLRDDSKQINIYELFVYKYITPTFILMLNSR